MSIRTLFQNPLTQLPCFLPVMLLADLMRLSESREDDLVRGDGPPRVGIALDVRAQGFETLTTSLARLRERGWRTHLIYLDATNEALVRRFESVRRPHPLQGKGRLLDAIQKEREVLADVRAPCSVPVAVPPRPPQTSVGLTSTIRASRPLMNFGDSSVLRSVARTTASATATSSGTSDE